MRLGSNKIDEERVCIDALVQHLKGLDATSSIEAQEESDDPPDYWLTVGEHRFAVEITSIVNDEGYAASCSTLHECIKKKLASDGPVVGKYAVVFGRRPNIPPRRTRQWQELVASAANDIRALAGSAPGSTSRVLEDVGGHITVSKCSAAGSAVWKVVSPEAKREVKAQAELSQLLEQAIGKKFRKLQKKGVMSKCPDVILLLYDAYGYCSLAAAMSAVSDVRGYEWLHSIFWAASFSDRPNVMYPDSPGRAGGFLYSKNEGWWRRA